MKIAYLGRHEQEDSADDEGSIHCALEQLGHQVFRLREERGKMVHKLTHCDFLLFHHLRNIELLKPIQGKIRLVFWCFDLIQSPPDPMTKLPDPKLASRDERRIGWMREILRVADLGFCTDGDWVADARYRGDDIGAEAHKLIWLPQGADERIVGRAEPSNVRGLSLLLTCGTRGGSGRESFVYEMRERYAGRIQHFEKGVYRERLRQAVADCEIVIAPDYPSTDHYWSNRVYGVLGFGGFLLHPYCSHLALQYKPDHEIKFYHDREQLHDKIAHYLSSSQERERIAATGLERTKREHLYRHRVESLVRTVKERLGI